MTTRPFKRITSSEDVRRTANHLGSYFFTPETMRYFGSRLLNIHRDFLTSDGSDEGLFVTSERDVYSDRPRHYTVRRYEVTRDDEGQDHIDITTVDSQQFDIAVRQYVITALWAEGVGEEGDPLKSLLICDEDDLSPIAWNQARAAVAGFLVMADDLLPAYWESGGDSSKLGHDLWLTRNGHGAGFWDRGQGEVWTQLSELARSLGEADPYVGDDGMVYGMD